MAKVMVQATSEGLTVPRELLAEAGVAPGDLVELDVAVLPNADQVQQAAIRHVVRKLGNAIWVCYPHWTGVEWRIELKSLDEELSIGALYYNAHGELLEGKSTSRETLG